MAIIIDFYIGVGYAPLGHSDTATHSFSASTFMVNHENTTAVQNCDKLTYSKLVINRAVNWDSRVQGLAGPGWTRESESSPERTPGLARKL